jgi:hypothetical protein
VYPSASAAEDKEQLKLRQQHYLRQLDVAVNIDLYDHFEI